MSEMLEKARKYEEEQGKQIKAEDRPAFHVSPYVGWMNDPNGFSYYQGEYHLFYQYYPYDTHWNSMHWGARRHKSRDCKIFFFNLYSSAPFINMEYWSPSLEIAVYT